MGDDSGNRGGIGLFVTGTDTGVGKTEVALALMARAVRAGRLVAGMKPVATGCRSTKEGLRNEDAERLRSMATRWFAYDDVNPYAFAPPVSPHIAAAEAGRVVRLDRVLAAFARLAAQSDVVIVEGVGGWAAPLSPGLAVRDLAVRLSLPVVLVVGLRLGCLNHAVLTAEAIIRDDLSLVGWVANAVDPAMERAAENVAYLRQALAAPLLGAIPHRARGCAALTGHDLTLPEGLF